MIEDAAGKRPRQAGLPASRRAGKLTDIATPPPEALVASWRQEYQRRIFIGARALSYVDVGTGPAVVLIHGLGQSWHCWAANLHDLARDHRVIAVDLPGCGGSDRRGWGDRDLAPYAGDIVMLLERIGASRPVVVGHSLGGIVAQWVALRLGVRCRGLLLVSSAGMAIPRPRLETMIAAVAILRALVYWPQPTALLLRIPAARDAILGGLVVNRDSLNDAYLRLLLSAYRGRGFWRAAHAARRDRVRLRVAELTTPTVLLAGDRDRLITPDMARQLAGSITGAGYHQWPRVGHAPQLERPSEFNDLVRTLVAQTSPAVPQAEPGPERPARARSKHGTDWRTLWKLRWRCTGWRSRSRTSP